MVLRQQLKISFFCVCFFAFSAYSQEQIKQEYAVSQLESIEVQGVGTLVLTQGDTDSLKIVGEREAVEAVKVDLTNHHLTLRSEGNKRLWRGLFSNNNDKLEFQLQVKNAKKIKLSGAVNARLSDIKMEKFEMDLSGAVTIETGKLTINQLKIDASGAVNFKIDSLIANRVDVDLSGAGEWTIKNSSRAQFVKINASGATHVNAEHLTGSEVYVDASGAAHIAIAAEKKLEAHASGASKIEYSGEAQLIKEDVSGVSDIKKR